MTRKSYQDLIAWQVSMDLVDAVYFLTKSFPKEERYGLISQLRDAAVSIPTNIAEGYGRSHRGDYVHHLSFAQGSAREVETLLLIARRQGFGTEEQLARSSDLCDKAGMLLTGLIRSLGKS